MRLEVSVTRWPFTFFVGIISGLATLAYLSGVDMNGWLGHPFRLWAGQLWRYASSSAIHVDPWHLIFNLYWFSEFGAELELKLGTRKSIGFFVFLAVISGACQFLVSGGVGIGLSGVVYGYFGLLWALGRGHRAGPESNEGRHRRRGLTSVLLEIRMLGISPFRTERGPLGARVLRPGVVFLFMTWLVMCFAMTHLKIRTIANAAHFGGLISGYALGMTLRATGRRRLSLGLVCAGSASLLALTFYMPWNYQWWWCRGIRSTTCEKQSFSYFMQAIDLAPRDAEVAELIEWTAIEAIRLKDLQKAVPLLLRAIDVGRNPGKSKAYLAYTYYLQGRRAAARSTAKELRLSDFDDFLKSIPEFASLIPTQGE